MCGYRIIFTPMNVWPSWRAVNLTYTSNSSQKSNLTLKQEQITNLLDNIKDFPSLRPPLPVSPVALEAHMMHVSGEEAAVVGLHACGVVSVMLGFRCADGPHTGSVLTLAECLD